MKNQLADLVIADIRQKVINQVKYQATEDYLSSVGFVYDDWSDHADECSDETAIKYLKDRDILSDDLLCALAIEIGMDELFDEDGWVDMVADYIYKNKRDCYSLWNHIRLL